MVKKLIFSLVVLLLLVSTISAMRTDVVVKTISNHNVRLVILDSGGSTVIESFNGLSDQYGDITFEANLNNEFKTIVYLKNIRNEKIYEEKSYETFAPGGEIYLEIVPSGYDLIETPDEIEEVEEEVIVDETEEVEETESKEEAGLSGYTIFGEEGIISWTILYIVGGIILLLIIVLVVLKLIKSRPKKEIVVKKLSEIKAESPNPEKKKEEIGTLEDQLKKLQEQIIAIKKQKSEEDHHSELDKRIEDKKKQIEKEEKDLIKLREEAKKG